MTSEIPEDVKQAARKAVYDTDGRGMVGRDRNYLEYRVQRAILAERERCANIAESSNAWPQEGADIAAAIRQQATP